jgi:hypothetical protein
MSSRIKKDSSLSLENTLVPGQFVRCRSEFPEDASFDDDSASMKRKSIAVADQFRADYGDGPFEILEEKRGVVCLCELFEESSGSAHSQERETETPTACLQHETDCPGEFRYPLHQLVLRVGEVTKVVNAKYFEVV